MADTNRTYWQVPPDWENWSEADKLAWAQRFAEEVDAQDIPRDPDGKPTGQ